MSKKSGSTPLAVIIAGYALAIGLCVIFALYMSAEIGWVFVYVLGAAVVFSFGITLAMKLTKSIAFTVECDKTMAYKGENISLRITVANRSFFPVPAVIVRLHTPEGLSSEAGSIFAVSVSPRSSTELDVTYKAKIWGKSVIGIESCRLLDFMRFFNFGLYNFIDGARYDCGVKVFPDIPDVPSDMPLIRSIASDIRQCEDSEETVETDGTLPFAGMPGYTHREYAEGDPIKRINWKLSSKKDSYMVRLDDEIESMTQTILLDCIGTDAKSNERAVEGTLAVAYSLFRLGFRSRVLYRMEGGFSQTEIGDYGDITALQTAFASYAFLPQGVSPKSGRIPSGASDENSSGLLLVTPCLTRELAAAVAAEESVGTNITVISAVSVFSGGVRSLWMLHEDYSAENIFTEK